jgi:hypothetical protein
MDGADIRHSPCECWLALCSDCRGWNSLVRLVSLLCVVLVVGRVLFSSVLSCRIVSVSLDVERCRRS